MDINNYSYLWDKGNFDNVLIKGNVGYIIFNKVNNSIISIENEVLNKQIISKMLGNGNPIYESIKDLKRNGQPLNVVGQPSKEEDFPIKRYKISIKWSKEISLTTQIKKLKDAFPEVKAKSNQELLEMAKKYEVWHFNTLYLDKVQVNELQHLAKEYGLNIILDYDDLKEVF